MTLQPLVSESPVGLREALVRRGVDPVHAEAAVRGLRPVALVFDGVDAASRAALAHAARQGGVECLTGEGWVLLASGAARLAGLVRPGHSALPPDVAEALGRYVSGAVERPVDWSLGRGSVSLEQPVVVGILNVTPDSFSDGGRFLDPGVALEHAAALVREGASMLDVGAESTRPGRPEPVSAEEEWRRLEPVLRELVRRHPGVPLSVDTVKAETAARALAAGAWAINDVSGLRLEPEVADVCAEHGAGLVLMHSRGTVSELASYEHATYDSVVGEVVRELERAVEVAVGRGVGPQRIVVDPGLGFAKRPGHNYEVLRGLPALAALGHPVMVGPSRKRFLGAVTGGEIAERDAATATVCAAAYLAGASLFRVHSVGRAREALALAHAIRSA